MPRSASSARSSASRAPDVAYAELGTFAYSSGKRVTVFVADGTGFDAADRGLRRVRAGVAAAVGEEGIVPRGGPGGVDVAGCCARPAREGAATRDRRARGAPGRGILNPLSYPRDQTDTVRSRFDERTRPWLTATSPTSTSRSATWLPAQEFYSTLFGWQIAEPPGFEGYPMWQAPNKISGGGLAPRERRLHPAAVVRRGGLDRRDARAAVKAGGTVAMEKQQISPTSWWAVIVDPDGNEIGLYEGTTEMPEALIGRGRACGAPRPTRRGAAASDPRGTGRTPTSPARAPRTAAPRRSRRRRRR